ncbi:MAG: PDZ domain-containing protein [Candidatus Spyradosoma sp.]
MRISKKIKAVAPLVIAAGLLTPAIAQEAKDVPAAKMNPASVNIVRNSVPLFGAAFGINTFYARGERKFGLPVIYVKEDSPAEKAGLSVGDILLSFDGQKLFFPNQFAALLRTYDPDDVVEIDFVHEGELKRARVQLCARTGSAVAVRGNEGGIVPAPNDKDDVRLLINGREIPLSKNMEWSNCVAVTPDAVIIRTNVEDVPADLMRVLRSFRARMPDPMESARTIDRRGRGELIGGMSAASQVYFADGNTVLLMRENDKREVTVRTAEDGEIFRGPCATQAEIEKIPPRALEIISGFTTLRPIAPDEDAGKDVYVNLKNKK